MLAGCPLGGGPFLTHTGKLLSVKNPAALQFLTQTGAPGIYYNTPFKSMSIFCLARSPSERHTCTIHDAFAAFHPDPNFVRKFLKPLLIGALAPTEPSQDHGKNTALVQDFQALRDHVEREGFLRARLLFFSLYLGHILLLEALALGLLWVWGTSWSLTLLCSLMLATSQAQASWLQHDFGHLSVFKKSSWNHVLQKFVIGHLKGASANWWNHRHFQHHAKPNVFSKDPDINSLHVFVLGDKQPVEYGIKKMKYMPYHHQHQYFFLIGPPLLIPVYFHIQILRTMFLRQDWVDLAWSMSFYLRFICCYYPFFGFFGSVALISFVSHSFADSLIVFKLSTAGLSNPVPGGNPFGLFSLQP
uniref:Fatty acid desaturase 2 n=1 Tax=Hucho hucho TaxID=62062 RepID=A0A4W5KX26_9TELE